LVARDYSKRVLITVSGLSDLRLLFITITLFLSAGKSFFLLIFIGQEKEREV
jgi:hypothetical protein